ncbi:MAG: VWA domain-containing protein [Acidobacteriota bacterium]
MTSIPRNIVPPSRGRGSAARALPWTRTLTALALLLASTAAWGQGEEPLFIERIDVNVINVEVFVVDEDGNAVTDLTQDDFEIFEDDQPVEVTNFYTTWRPDRATSDLERDRGLVRGEVPGVVEAAEVPADQRLHLVVYVDNFNLRPANRNRVLKELGGFLEDRVRQGDQVMLMSSGNTVEVVEPFTQDLYQLAKGIEYIGEQTAYGQQTESRRRRVIQQIDTQYGRAIDNDGEAQLALDFISSYIQQAQFDLERSTRALEATVRSLGGLPGRKAILYVSDGLPKRPGQELYQHYIDRFGQGVRGSGAALVDPGNQHLADDRSGLIKEVARQANAQQVTFYTLQAQGSTTGRETISAEHTPASFNNEGNTLADGIYADNLQEPMIDLSEETGGTAILNTFNFDDALADLSQDFDSLYSLGYRSRHGGDGGYHEIEVRVKREGLKVRHRAGYVDKNEEERVADRTFSSLILDLESNPLGITLELGTPEKEGRDKYHLPFLIRIPIREITLLPKDETGEGRLRLYIAVLDEEGGVSPLQEVPYPVSIPTANLADARDQQLGYAGKLLIRPGVPKIAIAVWDEISGSESFVHKSAFVGRKGKKERKERERRQRSR